jgi:predicted Zn-dependent peptidase
MIYRKTLSNGIRFIGKPLPSFSSVTIGVFIKAGSIDEDEENNGISHFLEHLLFKGTKSRSAKDIAFEIDRIGGELNAFTMREMTGVYTEVLKEYQVEAIEIMADMVINSQLLQNEIRKEKTVVIDELSYYEDSPDDLVDDLLHSVSYAGTPIEKPVAGNVETVNSLKRSSIVDFYSRLYVPENMVISASGNFDGDEIASILEEHFGKLKKKGEFTGRPDFQGDIFKPGFKHFRKSIELNHFSALFKGIEYSSDHLYALLMLNNIIGGSVSSRLFQKIREDHGLTYSIETSPLFYSDSGALNLYFTTLSEHVPKLSELLSREMKSYRKIRINDDEFLRAKNQLVSSYLMGLEHSGDIMNYLGKSELLGDPIRDKEEVLRRIDGVKKSDIEHVSSVIFDNPSISFASVGKILKKDSLALYKSLSPQ